MRGIGTYVRGLCGGMAALGVHPDLLLRAGEPSPPEIEGWGLREAGRIPVLKRRLQPLADHLLVMLALRRLRPSVYHAVEWAQPLRSPVPVVVTVHDLIPFLYPRLYPWMRRERLAALRLLRRADAVVAVSRCTADDTVRLARVDPRRIAVVHHGVAEEFTPRARRRGGRGARSTGAAGPVPARGRHLRPAQAGGAAHGGDRPSRRAGAAPGGGRRPGRLCRRRRHRGGARRGVGAHPGHRSPPPPRPGGAVLGRRVPAFTSAYEGFGLPLLEAMACGTPVVAFRNSALGEVGGEAAVLVEDGDAAALAAAARRLLEDPRERSDRVAAGRSRAAGFTWEATARGTLEVYRSVGGM